MRKKNPNRKKLVWTRRSRKESTDSEDKLINLPDQFRDFAASAFKELLEHRTILINGDIDEDLIEKAVVQIEKFSTEKPKEPITIMVNTYGGSVYEMYSIIDAMRHTKTPITTIALGKVMSAGFGIFLAGDYRIAGPNTIFMTHNGSNDMGDAKLIDHITESDYFKKILENEARYYASRTTVSQKEWLDILQSNKDRYIFADEAKKMGIIHDIQEPQLSKYRPHVEKKRKRTKRVYSKKIRRPKKRKSRK